jgi:hypothetical protein
MKYHGIIAASFLVCTSVLVKHNSGYPLSDDDWKVVVGKVVLLE